MPFDHYTYRVTWSAEDKEYVGLCAEFRSLSWLADSQAEALEGVRQHVADVVRDMRKAGEKIPEALADQKLQWEISGADSAATASRVGD
ncbi:hypothetical protein CBA19C6_11050 [Cupriavidus pauculus]|nr:hypothetical protein CBA19C6_11050 [Cupriavidus pauculus]